MSLSPSWADDYLREEGRIDEFTSAYYHRRRRGNLRDALRGEFDIRGARVAARLGPCRFSYCRKWVMRLNVMFFVQV